MKQTTFTLFKTIAVLLALCFSGQQVLAQCTPVTRAQALRFCDSGTFTVGNTTRVVSASAVYLDTLIGAAANGCDSIIRSSVTVQPTPAPAAQLPNLTVCSGQTIPRIDFNLPDTTTFTKWRSSNPTIGLKTMGVDYIPSFVAVNNGTTPIIDTISVVVKSRGHAWIPAGNRIYKYNLSNMAITDSTDIPDGRVVTSVIYNHSGTTMFAAGLMSYGSANPRERKIYAFDNNTGDFLRAYDINPELYFGGVYALYTNMCVSPDDQEIIFTTSVYINNWQYGRVNLETGALTLYTVPFGHPDYWRTRGLMCLSPDGTKIYSTTMAGQIYEYAYPSFTLLRTLTSAPNSCFSLICSPDGKRLFAGGVSSPGNTFYAIDIAADTLIATITSPASPNYYTGGFSYTPDSTGLIVGFSEQQSANVATTPSMFRIFDINTYQLRSTIGALGGKNAYWQFISPINNGANTEIFNGFMAPDGRNFITHAPSLVEPGNAFGVSYRRFSASGAPAAAVNFQSVNRNHPTNRAGSFGNPCDAGHCESQVMSFTITIYPNTTTAQDVVLCGSQTYTIGGHTYSTTGTYIDTLQSVHGCDSIVITDVLANQQSITHTQVFNFCNSGTFTAAGITRTVTASGVYLDTLAGAAVSGCDSIVKTIVTVTPTPAPVAQVSDLVLCNGDTSSIIQLPVADNATFAKWRTTQKGIGLHYIGLNEVPSFVAVNNTDHPITDTISVVVKGKGYLWHPSGDRIYKIDLATYQMVDSAMIPNGKIIHNIVFSPDYSTMYAVAISGEAYQRKIYAFSTYNGDYIRTYTVTPGPGGNFSTDQKHGNMRISPDGNYLYLVSHEYSRFFHLHKVNTVTGAVTTVTRGYQHPYWSHLSIDMDLTKDGSKLYISRIEDGIEELDANTLTHIRFLMPNRTQYFKMALSADEKRIFVVHWHGLEGIEVIDIASGLVVDTIPAYTDGSAGNNTIGSIIYNADSSRIIVLKGEGYPNTNNAVKVREFNASTYEPYGIADRVLGNGQLYRHNISQLLNSPLTNYVNYCVTPDGRGEYFTRILADILNCNIRPYPYVFNTPALYQEPLPFGAGGGTPRNAGSIGNVVYPGYCESQVMKFTITVNPTARDTQQVTICEGRSFTAGSHAYTTSGVYADTIPNGGMYNCDSIIVTNLTVLPYARSYQSVNLCGSGSITVGPYTHNTTGYYVDTLFNASSTGCDSLVYTNLTIGAAPASPTVTLNNQTVCAGATVPATTLGTGIQWAGSTTAIGLAASGTATVPAFTAINNGNTAITDTISVTASAPGFAYVANPNFSRVTVINRLNNSVVTNITGLSGASGVSVNPAATRVYVGGQNTNSVYVLNTATNTLSTTIPVGTQPFNVAVNPAGNRIYTANNGSNNVSVIDTLTNTVIATIPVGTNPRGIAVHPDGKRVYVANSGSDNISVINTLTNTVIATIPVGDNPYGLAINAAGNRVYVTNLIAGTVSVINAETNTVIATITVGDTPRGIAVTNDGTKVYVASFLNNLVTVINAGNNTITTTIGVGNRPTGVSISADGTLAYVTNSLGNSVSVISTATNTVTGSISGLPGPDCLGNFTSGSGCSSAPVQYQITVNPKPQYTQQVSLCAGSSITVGSHTYNTSGTYIDTLANASVNGCDSIVTTQLTINSPVATTVNATICQGQNYAGHTSTGIYTDTYSNINGCDSVRTLNLTVAPVFNTNITTSICQGQSYEGYTTTGIYTDVFTSIAGCDSTRVLNLTVYPNYTNTTTATICGNQVPYTWNGQPYYFTGIYTNNLTSVNGCDSTEILDLTVNPATTWWRDADGDGDGNQFVDSVSCSQPVGYVDNSDDCNDNDAAVNSSLVWYIDMDNDGYGSTAQVYNGCDPGSPIFVLDGTDCDDFNGSVHATFTFYVDNDGDTYGSSTQATVCAVDATTPPAGYSVNNSDCNDGLFNATAPQSTSSVTNLDVCQSALPYTWNGLTFNSAGSQTATGFTNDAGCDSTATLNLSILPAFNTTISQTILAGNTYNFYGNILSVAGTYNHTLTASNGCDSIITLNLTVQSAGVTLTWTGAADQNWHNANNWSPALVPVVCSQDVQIPVTANQPIIAGAAGYANNITLADGAIITLQNQSLFVCGNWISGNISGSATANVGGGEVVLNGTAQQNISGHTNFQVLTLNNASGAIVSGSALVEISEGLHLQTGNLDNQGEVVLLSPDELKAAYLDDFSAGFTGYLSGNITAQRGVGGSGNWQHFISSPVNSPALNALTTLSGPNGTYVTPSSNCSENVLDASSATGTAYEWVEAALVTPGCYMGNWMIRSTGNMANGRSYSVYLSSGVYDLTSAPNTGDIPVVGLSNSNWSTQSAEGNTFTSGWHMLGNPYPSPVELDVNHAITEGFDAQVQVWMPNGPWQGTWDARLMGVDAQLASSQGFQVHNSNVGTPQTFTFTNAERRRTSVVNPAYFQMPNQSALNVIVEGNNGRRDRTRVYFNTDATVNFDQLYDADKLISNMGYPTVYTWMATAPERRMGINTLTDIATTTTVPMAFLPGADATFTITAEGINTFDPTSYIMLEDILTGTMHNLRNGAYTFTSSVTDARNRFVLHFTPAAEINTTASSCANDGVIVVTQPGTAVWNYSVSNTQGTILSSGLLNQGAPATVNNLNAGVYTLTLTDNNGYTVVKNIQVTGPASVNPTFVAPATANVGQNITFNNTTTGAVSYEWTMGDGTIFSGIASPQYSYDTPGQYTVTLTTINADGCSSSVSQTITVSLASGIDNLETTNLNIYGAGNKVYVDFSKLKGVEATIEIYNVIGQNLSTEKFSKSSIYAKEIKNLEAAYVIVKVINNGEITTKKVFLSNSK